jgi:hypothetical protein
VSYYYVCTRQQHEGGKYSCQAGRIPAIALEDALIGRIRDIGRMVEARDRIVQEALSCLGDEAVRLREEEDHVRRRLGQVHADIGKLVEVLKSLGSRGLASVQVELERLEGEERQLKDNLVQLARRQEPVEQVGDNARAFLESWQDIGELLESATPQEQMQLLQHYIEVVELGAIDRQTRTGTYAMRLFPEVRPDRGFDFSGGNGPDDSNPGPETTNGAIHVNGNGSAVVNPGRIGSHNRPESSARRIRTFDPPVNSRLVNDSNPEKTSESAPSAAPVAAGLPDEKAGTVDLTTLPEHVRRAVEALIASAGSAPNEARADASKRPGFRIVG